MFFFLFLLLPFGALLVINCGKDKKEDEEKQKKKIEEPKISPNEGKQAEEREKKLKEQEAEEKKTKMEQERKERDQAHKELLGKQEKEMKEFWEHLKKILDSCDYFDQFHPCNLAYRVRFAYIAMRDQCHRLANISGQTNIKYWSLYEEEIGARTYIPFFRELKEKFKERHGEHLDQKTTDETLGIFKQIEKDFELIIEGKKKHENDESGQEIQEELMNTCAVKDLEPWMKPSFHEEFKKKYRPYSLWSKHDDNGIHSTWTRQTFDNVLKTCRKKLFGGQCDFMERGNYYIAEWRRHAQSNAPFSRQYSIHETYASTEDVIKYEVEISEKYMETVSKAKDEHREHFKDSKEFDDWFKLHTNKTKELKNRYEASKNKDNDWNEGTWREIIGHRLRPICVDLREE